MTLTQKSTLSAAITALLFAAALVVGIGIKHAEAATSDFSQPCGTNQATSTLNYMTPGTGTTTLACPIGATSRLADGTVNLHLQVTATSTGVSTPTLNFRVEVSRNNIDWYPTVISANTTLGTGLSSASTTVLTTDPYNNFSLKVSTSTSPTGDFGGTGTATRVLYAIRLFAPEPYLRVKFTSPTSGGNIGLWADIFGKLAL